MARGEPRPGRPPGPPQASPRTTPGQRAGGADAAGVSGHDDGGVGDREAAELGRGGGPVGPGPQLLARDGQPRRDSSRRPGVGGGGRQRRLPVHRAFHSQGEELARDGRGVLHLESAEEVVIVHGDFEDAGHPRGLTTVLGALAAKYDRPEDRQYLPSENEEFDVVHRLRPRRALLWQLSDYDASQARWDAPPGS